MMKNIRCFAFALCVMLTWGVAVNAQSMSDEQVMQFVVTEYNKGTSQSQIVTKLMQKGVDINQIRRVRQKYERQAKNGGLGIKDITGEEASDNRLRTNNAKDKKQSGGQMQMQKELSLEERSLQIKARLSSLPKTFSFETLIDDCEDVTSVIVTFLAILDLARLHTLTFTTDDNDNIYFARG